MTDADGKLVEIGVKLPTRDHARAKAAAALAGMSLKHYAAQAVMDRVKADEATWRESDEEARDDDNR